MKFKFYAVLLSIFIVGCSSPAKNWQVIHSQTEVREYKNYKINQEITTVVGSPMISSRYVKGISYYKAKDLSITAWRGLPITEAWLPKYVYPSGDGDYVLTSPSYYQHAIGIIVNKDGSVPENPVMRIDKKGSEKRYPIIPYKKDLFEVDFMSTNKNDTQNYELIYSGKSNSTINIVYREYIGNLVKEGFKQNLTYDLNESNIIQFKKIKIDIIKATNTNIVFKVLENGV